MIRRSLETILSRGTDGRFLLTSPALGVYGDPPRSGEGLIAGSVVGTLVILGRKVDLLVPEGGAGTVAEIHVRDRETPVAFGQPLVSISQPSVPGEPKTAGRASRAKVPSKETSLKASAAAARARNHAASPASPSAASGAAPSGGAGSRPTDTAGGSLGDGDLPPGSFALRSPTTGVFYARSDPDSPPFAVQGATLETGQTAGLIEVMKCFSPIVHPGGALPSPAIVETVNIRDGEEVRPGQILFVLRRA